MMMAEYIEREAAIREMYKEPSYYDPVNILTEVRDRIKAIPAADVRGVVHCGECSHADKDLPGAIYCTMWDAWEVPEDGFCYKGAKMEVSDE